MTTEKYIVEKDTNTGDVINVEKVEEETSSPGLVGGIVGLLFDAAFLPFTGPTGLRTEDSSSNTGGKKH